MMSLKTHGRKFDALQYDPGANDEEDLAICALDPLKADGPLRRLPLLNQRQDVPGLIQLLRSLMPSMEEAARFSRNEAVAAVRDLGMLLGSLKKLKVEPLEAVPELEPILLHLGRVTDFPPRDTVSHYTLWNPDGERQRRYTVHPEEGGFLDGSKLGAIHVHNAIRQIARLHGTPLVSEEFAPAAEQIARELQGLVDAILFVARAMPRKLFAEEIRFYFDPIHIAGQEYLGPGSVEVPTYAIDHILWNSHLTDSTYVQFKRGYLPYAKPWVRECYARFDGKPPLLVLAAETLSSSPRHPHLPNSAAAALKLMDTLLKFRMPHKRLADEAYTQSNSLNPGRTHGSGGYEPSILDHINNLTLQARNTFKAQLQAYVERTGAQAAGSRTAA